MIIAIENPNPLGVYLLDDDTSRSFEQVLKLPLERDVSALGDLNNTESTPAAAESDWRKSVELSYIEDDDLKDRILRMLSKHEEMPLAELKSMNKYKSE